jgi:hypothetical protein
MNNPQLTNVNDIEVGLKITSSERPGETQTKREQKEIAFLEEVYSNLQKQARAIIASRPDFADRFALPTAPVRAGFFALSHESRNNSAVIEFRI